MVMREGRASWPETLRGWLRDATGREKAGYMGRNGGQAKEARNGRAESGEQLGEEVERRKARKIFISGPFCFPLFTS